MSRRVTATEAARQFSDLLNRVRYEGETFVIVRGGEEVGQLVPTQPNPSLTLRSLFEILDSEAAPDPEFADDLEAIQREQPLAGETPWPS
jgi:prevent-host-death family protein